MIRTKKLKEIAQLQKGVYCKPVHPTDKNHLPYIQLSDFQGMRFIGSSQMVRAEDVNEKYHIHSGDVLFSTYLKFNAHILPERKAAPYVASGHLIILRPDTEIVSPAYLAWYLNTGIARRQMMPIIEGGSRVPFITKQHLQDFHIQILPMEKQRQIVDLYQLRQREKGLISQIEAKKDILITEILENQLKR